MKYEDQSNLKYLPKEKESKRRWPGRLAGFSNIDCRAQTSGTSSPNVARQMSSCREPVVQVSSARSPSVGKPGVLWATSPKVPIPPRKRETSIRPSKELLSSSFSAPGGCVGYLLEKNQSHEDIQWRSEPIREQLMNFKADEKNFSAFGCLWLSSLLSLGGADSREHN
ncbi:hypothetical protein OUZ56_029733 [Daphnia magna]|uniref:Uncharacterized protein n=1 Tax=Daphnia magna TaxID=35525 RepID=A0ABR0B7N6_9CRUS|nr:hypothetical protein OUZ56_029733 [Daphnia magna]